MAKRLPQLRGYIFVWRIENHLLQFLHFVSFFYPLLEHLNIRLPFLAHRGWRYYKPIDAYAQ
eukprot:XP_001707714.1 Hypothetical protein GL50803_37426 [Giardia lamblia ATCC 50803]